LIKEKRQKEKKINSKWQNPIKKELQKTIKGDSNNFAKVSNFVENQIP
jgi:formiminotetrahydrofolate cyclodeaminase